MAHIIHKITPTWQSDRWQSQFAGGFRDTRELLDYLGIDPARLHDAFDPDSPFPMRVPLSFAARMRKGIPADPLLAQVLPLRREHDEHPGYISDPVGDLAAEKVPGLLHKYHGRALVVLTAACAVHCRYCFRRHYPYQDSSANGAHRSAILDYLANTTSISEVILSGGDPLSLDDDKLGDFISHLKALPHITTIRLHTRLPVVLPARVTARLCRILSSQDSQFVVVLHINHPNEVNEEVMNAVRQLDASGCLLLNQAVLLRGVNDNPSAQIGLSKKLMTMRVQPYYLHLLDKVAGAAHFHVPTARARDIMNTIRTRLPGYLVPKLVLEQAGEASKTPIY
jgi:EF-P beta-lysylation protein EpmB